ncbi:MAG: hypothetical protein RR482_05180 [Clostridia bacterium]
MSSMDTLRLTAEEMLSGLKASEALKRRIVCNVHALETLPQTAGEMLGGLHVTSALRHRILVGAARKRPRQQAVRQAARRFSPAMGMAMVLVVMLCVGALYANRETGISAPGLVVGNSSTPGTSGALGGQAAGDMISGSLKLGDNSVPQYRSLFTVTDNGAQALIAINGRYYQMLSSPFALEEKLKGSQFGDIQQRITEFSTTGQVGVFSNVANAGDPIYSVDGFSTRTMVAAPVNGHIRLFQRVAYAGNALLGNENFAETLSIQGEVAVLELSGIGIISDPVKANGLMEMLLEEAVWNGDAVPTGDQMLTIYLKNNLSLQLNVSEDVVSACGAWACPDFFDAFKAELKEAE